MRRCLDSVHDCLRVPVDQLSRTLPHDAFTVIPSHFGGANDLVDWLEGRFLPTELPQLPHSLALKRAH